MFMHFSESKKKQEKKTEKRKKGSLSTVTLYYLAPCKTKGASRELLINLIISAKAAWLHSCLLAPFLTLVSFLTQQ